MHSNSLSELGKKQIKFLYSYRSSHPQVFCKEDIKILENSQAKTSVGVCFNQVAGQLY